MKQHESSNVATGSASGAKVKVRPDPCIRCILREMWGRQVIAPHNFQVAFDIKKDAADRIIDNLEKMGLVSHQLGTNPGRLINHEAVKEFKRKL